MREADLLTVLARLTATIGRIVLLAYAHRQPFMIVFTATFLNIICHALEAIEKSLQEAKEMNYELE